VPPSQEVLEQIQAEHAEAWEALDEVVKVAREEEQEIIDGSKYDHTHGPNRDTLAVIIDPEVKEACRRALDATGAVLDAHRRGHQGDLVDSPPGRHATWVMKRLIWDEKGIPWTGPLAKKRS
jgi:hypothetical protein